MQVIALTGGIASGKSTVSQRLAELGAVVVDADKIVREVQRPGEDAFERIVETFGPGVIAEDGTLNRPALGAIVFSDEAKRLALNAIVHPAVQERVAQRIAETGARDPDAVVVYDVPLLAEGARDPRGGFDRVVVVHTPADERIERMVRDRGMTEADARARIGAQASDDARLAVADTVLDNTGTRGELIAQVDELWADLTR
ncbi:dephospho-CoA kinase [Gryllotalpicola sp.]|uniref:dephospho-CoA kinase n=1 Tax=Gryllotalpicola sp. TaxID=1932787 RepID=UPI002621A58B|nr:dephospho-CoA kinase [Gryllotalpicola sp.]